MPVSVSHLYLCVLLISSSRLCAIVGKGYILFVLCMLHNIISNSQSPGRYKRLLINWKDVLNTVGSQITLDHVKYRFNWALAMFLKIMCKITLISFWWEQGGTYKKNSEEKKSVNPIYLCILYQNVLHMLFHFSFHNHKTNYQKCVTIRLKYSLDL